MFGRFSLSETLQSNPTRNYDSFVYWLVKLPDVRQHEINRMHRFNAPSVVYLKMALPENRVLLLLGVSRNWGEYTQYGQKIPLTMA